MGNASQLAALACVAVVLGACTPPSNPVSNCEGWADGPPLSTARTDHTMTLLGDGRVLVTGGETPDGVTASTEIWSASSDSWSAGPELLEPRAGHAAVLLEDGRVLLAGGTDVSSGGGLDSSEIFDPASDSVARAAYMSGPHLAARAVRVPDGRVLLMSGVPATGEPATDFYDPTKDTWRSPGDLNERLDYPSINLIGDTFAAVVGHAGQNARAVEFWYDATSPGEIGEQFESLDAPECIGRGHTSVSIGSNAWLLLGGTRGSADGCVATVRGGGPKFDVILDQLAADNVIQMPGDYVFAGTAQEGALLNPIDLGLETFPTFALANVRSVVRDDGVVMTSGGLDSNRRPVTTTKLSCN